MFFIVVTTMHEITNNRIQSHPYLSLLSFQTNNSLKDTSEYEKYRNPNESHSSIVC